MGFLTTYAVDGSRTPAAVARRAQYASTKNAGVVEPDHCRLVPVSGGTVGLTAGAVLVPAGTSGNARFERYVATVESTDGDATASVAVPSATSRTFEAVVVVPDPQWAGISAPPNPLDASYAQLRLLTAAQYSALTTPHYRVATLVIPANAGAVTAAMITDRRRVADPRRERFTRDVVVETVQNLTSSNFVTFPSESSLSIDVPPWATRAIVRCDLLETLLTGAASTDGRMTLMLGNQAAYTSERRFDEVWAGATSRDDHTIVSSFTIPASFQGTARTLALRARRLGGTGYLRADTYTQVVYDIEFIEDPA